MIRNSKGLIKMLKKINKFYDSVNKFIKPIRDFENSIHKAIKAVNASWDIINIILKQLDKKGLDQNLIADFPISNIIELYYLSEKIDLTFADLMEDNLALFGTFKYKKAVNYLNILNTRINKQTIKKENISLTKTEENFLDSLKKIEIEIAELIENSLEEYKNSNIILKEEEIDVLNCFKENQHSKNKDIAKKIGYSESKVEKICAEIRNKFNIDFIEDLGLKRHFLKKLAKNIQF